MRIADVLRKLADHRSHGTGGGFDSAVNINVGGKGRSHSRVSTRRRIVQRNGRTVVDTTVRGDTSDSEGNPEGDRSH